MGSNYSSKVEEVFTSGGQEKPTRVQLQIWDTAGSEQFRSITQIYYQNAAAVCLVYDSTNEESFGALQYWVDELNNKADPRIMKTIVASKVDMVDDQQVSIQVANKFAKSIKAPLFQTSSLDGQGINQMFRTIAEKLQIAEEATM